MLQNIQFQTSDTRSTTIRTYPHINATYTQLFTNPSNLSSNVSNIPRYNTVSPSTIHQSTVSQPTYITLLHQSLKLSNPLMA